jgi:hypothetical protein
VSETVTFTTRIGYRRYWAALTAYVIGLLLIVYVAWDTQLGPGSWPLLAFAAVHVLPAIRYLGYLATTTQRDIVVNEVGIFDPRAMLEPLGWTAIQSIEKVVGSDPPIFWIKTKSLRTVTRAPGVWTFQMSGFRLIPWDAFLIRSGGLAIGNVSVAPTELEQAIRAGGGAVRAHRC